jgi:hypothetical protein
MLIAALGFTETHHIFPSVQSDSDSEERLTDVLDDGTCQAGLSLGFCDSGRYKEHMEQYCAETCIRDDGRLEVGGAGVDFEPTGKRPRYPFIKLNCSHNENKNLNKNQFLQSNYTSMIIFNNSI